MRGAVDKTRFLFAEWASRLAVCCAVARGSQSDLPRTEDPIFPASIDLTAILISFYLYLAASVFVPLRKWPSKITGPCGDKPDLTTAALVQWVHPGRPSSWIAQSTSESITREATEWHKAYRALATTLGLNIDAPNYGCSCVPPNTP